MTTNSGHFKNQNPKKMMSSQTSPSFSKTESMRTTKPSMISSKAATTSSDINKNHEPHPLSARTFKNSKATWSMSPLIDALPGSPPPLCSSGSSSPLSSSATFATHKSDSFDSDRPTTKISTPRNQDGMGSAKGFDRFCQPNLQINNPKGHRLKLPMRETPFLDPNDESDNIGLELSSAREESSVHNEEYKNVVSSADESSNEGSDAESPKVGRVMDRPKPYHEFLDEVKKQELKAEIEAWKKAERMRLMTKLRREEAAIDDWEFKQTSKALKEIKRLESKLEKQRAQAVENTWKTISIAKEEANKKKIKVRRSTIGKISAVSETYQRASFSTKKFIWHKVTAYCKSMYFKSVRCTALTSELRRS